MNGMPEPEGVDAAEQGAALGRRLVEREQLDGRQGGPEAGRPAEPEEEPDDGRGGEPDRGDLVDAPLALGEERQPAGERQAEQDHQDAEAEGELVLPAHQPRAEGAGRQAEDHEHRPRTRTRTATSPRASARAWPSRGRRRTGRWCRRGSPAAAGSRTGRRRRRGRPPAPRGRPAGASRTAPAPGTTQPSRVSSTTSWVTSTRVCWDGQLADDAGGDPALGVEHRERRDRAQPEHAGEGEQRLAARRVEGREVDVELADERLGLGRAAVADVDADELDVVAELLAPRRPRRAPRRGTARTTSPRPPARPACRGSPGPPAGRRRGPRPSKEIASSRASTATVSRAPSAVM